MKNFIQFIVPLLIIIGVGTIVLLNNNPKNYTKRLYIKCNNTSKNYEVFTGTKLYFAEKNEKCKLDIEVLNVDQHFIKINTPYLWGSDNDGIIDKQEAKEDNIIQADTETILYSYDEQTKYIFAFK